MPYIFINGINVGDLGSLFNKILTHTEDINGNDIYTWDNDLSVHVKAGPFVVIDNNGNVVCGV